MEKDKNEKQPKTTNEKPIKIPLEFEDALTALLQVKPEDIDRKKKRKPQGQEKKKNSD